MWAPLLSFLSGVWLMVAPAVFEYGDKAVPSDNDQIIGPIVASIGLIAAADITRNIRWANVLLGAWLLLAPWVLGYDQSTAIINDMVTGAVVIGLALIKGKVDDEFGGGWQSLFQKYPSHQQQARPYQPYIQDENNP